MSDAPAQEDDFSIEPTGSRLRKIAIVAVVVLAGAFIVGLVGQLSGVGWFGYRSTLYGTGELYALNMGPDPLFVSVDGREKLEVSPRNAELIELIGGTSQVMVTDADDTVVGRYVVAAKNSHALLKLTDEGCLVGAEISSFYGGGAGNELEIAAQIEEKDRVWVPESVNVIWPRKTFPKQLTAGGGEGVWVETVACQLLEEDPQFIETYLTIQLQERMKKSMGKKGL